MTPLFAPRAAEEFDRVLDGTAPRAVADRYADLLGTVETLRSQPAVAPRPEFAAELRSRLMTAAETDLVAAPSVVRRLPVASTRTSRSRHLGTVAASLVIVGGTAGMAAAASGSLPGEALYPVKRGIEQVTAAVHIGDASKGAALLGHAETRLEEARELQAAGADPGLVAQTIDDFRAEATDGADHLFAAYASGGRDSDITQVRSFTATHISDIARMSASGDQGTADVLVDAADTLADIDQQARDLCATCGSSSSLEVPTALSSGAGAASLDTLLARPVSQAQRDIVDTRRAVAAAQQARLDRIAELRGLAETTAGTIPRIDTTPGTSGVGSTVGAPSVPMTSTLTPSGGLVQTVTVTGGSAVSGLVKGVTGTVSSTTGSITQGTPLQQPVDDVLDGLGETVDGVTGGLTGGSQGSGGLLP